MLALANSAISEEVGASLLERVFISTMHRGHVIEIKVDGDIVVKFGSNLTLACDVLLIGVDLTYNQGDEVLVHVPPGRVARGVVLGRVGRLTAPLLPATVTIEATEAVTLKCGEASIDLRADGKVLIKGDDVLVRAKGTQRIRAGSVSIN